ncbi:hypothetical protein ASPACDRAFT_50669 [Aspergillus aculeatus ATCC 16872]|uniref:Uncharacterized protein n=1 Tax=Aspergillus aculeatus (strain ATCC 16872 / CBS 172.66 / WB 5094) TaxID=690307 RepID=A0A1L9WZZ2_ASPA1|nr:uncharacterized protein ASPACDRAFT_50669 [Aspergillus aculeatus ATCC 16872]OJK01832.1 hypothetical protein ASPACDRAFT_50669 [Aspergillus aculeatus ATCC 16872]
MSSNEPIGITGTVNRQWNRVAGFYLSRHLTLHLESSTPEPPCRVLRLLDLTHILPHIRRLTLICQERRLNPVIRLVEKLHDFQQLDLLMCPTYPLELLGTVAVTHPHPRCRLSISPLLHTVQIVYPEDQHVPYAEHSDRALRDILRQVPYIRRLSLQLRPGRWPASRVYQNYYQWFRIQPTEGEMDPRSRTCLEVLTLPLSTTMTVEGFEAWSGVVNWQSLTAWVPGIIEDITVLSTIASQQPFRALQRLTLFLRPPRGIYPLANWTQAVQGMFDGLPPLIYLCLLGPYEPVLLLAVIHRHGPTLMELQLDRDRRRFQRGLTFGRLEQNGPVAPIFMAEVIAAAATPCTVLRTLRICVQLHRGHPVGAAAYDALGQLAALRMLHLILICLSAVVATDRPASELTPSPPRALTPLEQELLGGGCPKWMVRDQTINSAIDESLATAIFMRIQRGKPSDSPGRSHDNDKEMAGAWKMQLDDFSGMVRAENQYRPSPRHRTMRSADLEIFESIWPSNNAQTNKIWPLAWQSCRLQRDMFW